MTALNLAELLRLSAEQRLELIEALWESLTRQPEAVPTPDWHREILLEREAKEEADLGDTWDVVKARLERQL